MANQEKDRELNCMGDVSPYETQIIVHLGEMDREIHSVIGHLQRDGEETYNLAAIILQHNDLAFFGLTLKVKVAI
jgi:hypothetical protein